MRNSFDIDGVIYMGPGRKGVYPGPDDVIITGRSLDEKDETLEMLHARGIHNKVFFNPTPFESKTRESSGRWKATVLYIESDLGRTIDIHFEDDEIQAAIIREYCPFVNVVLLQHNLISKENHRNLDWNK